MILIVRPVALAGVAGSVTFHNAPAGDDELEADCVWYCSPRKDTVTESLFRAVQPQMTAGLLRWITMLELNTELTTTGAGGGGGRPRSPLHAPAWWYHVVPGCRRKQVPCTTVSPQVQPPHAELFVHRAQQSSFEATLLMFGPSELPWPLVSACLRRCANVGVKWLVRP